MRVKLHSGAWGKHDNKSLHFSSSGGSLLTRHGRQELCNISGKKTEIRVDYSWLTVRKMLLKGRNGWYGRMDRQVGSRGQRPNVNQSTGRFDRWWNCTRRELLVKAVCVCVTQAEAGGQSRKTNLWLANMLARYWLLFWWRSRPTVMEATRPVHPL